MSLSSDFQYQANLALNNESDKNESNGTLAPDRFLNACPIRHDCRSLFIYLVEMEYCTETNSIETFLRYPEERDSRNFATQQLQNDFIENVKKFAFPFMKNISSSQPSSLVQFYTFVFTDANRIRQYGFCRSSLNGRHILCLISYLPWYNVFNNLLNRITTIINENETQQLYNYLEALYEYNLPEPGNYAHILSHDGLEEVRFLCPDRRVVPSIKENRNLLKFFAFFDLDIITKIFTALLLERSILVVSKDLENLTACGLSFEYLLYPLEWLHTFAPILPEHIDLFIFNQPFPFIYGIHTCTYKKLLDKFPMDHAIILLVDEKQILNADKDRLPDNLVQHLNKKLKYFQEMESYSIGEYKNQFDLLRQGPIKAFMDAVLTIVDDYREYIVFDALSNEFKFDQNAFLQVKNVDLISQQQASRMELKGFYYEFLETQSFTEFCRDRCDYLKAEKQGFYSNGEPFRKDFVDFLVEQAKNENPKLNKFIDKGTKIFGKLKNKAKEKSKMLFNTPSSSSSSSSSHAASVSKSSSKSNAKKSLEYGFENKMATVAFDIQEIRSEQPLNEQKEATMSPSSGRSLTINNQLIDFEEQIDNRASSKSSLTDERQSAHSSKLSDHRVTMDLSNDPDLIKYFQETTTSKISNNASSPHEFREENRNKKVQVELITNEEAQIKLIDFCINDNNSDSIEKSIDKATTMSTSPNSNQLINMSTISSLNNNNDRKTKNLDDLFFDQLLSINNNQNAKLTSDNTKREESELDYFLSNNKNNNKIKQSDTNVNPFSVFATSQNKQSDSTSLRSIINEFDPCLSSTEPKSNPIETTNSISNKLATESKPFVEFDLINMMNKPAATATVTSTPSSCLLNNNFANLTARPFQVPLNTNYFQAQQPQQQRSNNLFYSPSINEPKAQSINVSSLSSSSQRPILNPFAPTPYHNFNSTAMTNYYRPVHFQQQQQPANNKPDAALDSFSSTSTTKSDSNKDVNFFE